MLQCSHGLPYESKCSQCLKEGLERASQQQQAAIPDDDPIDDMKDPDATYYVKGEWISP